MVDRNWERHIRRSRLDRLPSGEGSVVRGRFPLGSDLPAPESQVGPGEFSTAQRAGLAAIGFDLVLPLEPASVQRLRVLKSHHFGDVILPLGLGNALPAERMAAFRSRRPELENIVVNEMMGGSVGVLVADVGEELKKTRLSEGATLEGIRFRLPHISAIVQADIHHMMETGRPLLDGVFALTADYHGREAVVGHFPGSRKIHVDTWYPGKLELFGAPGIKVVAVPAAILEEAA